MASSKWSGGEMVVSSKKRRNAASAEISSSAY